MARMWDRFLPSDILCFKDLAVFLKCRSWPVTMHMHASGRCNLVFILTCMPWLSCDPDSPRSVSRHMIAVGLPPQIGRGAQNRACGTLAPRTAAEAPMLQGARISRREPEWTSLTEPMRTPATHAMVAVGCAQKSELRALFFSINFLGTSMMSTCSCAHAAGSRGSIDHVW